MKKFLLSFMLICSSILATSQSSFLNFKSVVTDSGGIAAYCLSGHLTTQIQGVYVNQQGICTTAMTRAYYNIGSRDLIQPGANLDFPYHGARLTGSNGFPQLTNILAFYGVDFRRIKIYFQNVTLGNDVQGTDWFSSGSTETRFYNAPAGMQRTFLFTLDGESLVTGFMPTMELKINYNNQFNCSDDSIKAKCNYTSVYRATNNNTPIFISDIATAFLLDVGDRGIAFDFSTLTSAIQNAYQTPNWINCNAPLNFGAFYECENGKILLSDNPLDSNTSNPIPTPLNCSQTDIGYLFGNSGEWVHMNHNNNPVFSILDNSHMSAVSGTYYTTNNVRSVNGVEYLGRNFIVTSADEPAVPARLRFYFTREEWNALIAANDGDANDPHFLSDLIVTRVCNTSCQANIAANDFGELIPVVESGVFNNGYYVDILTNKLGQFYLHGGNTALLPAPPAPQGAVLNCTIGNNTLLVTNRLGVIWTHTNPAVATLIPAALSNRINVNALANGVTDVSYWIENANGCKMQSASLRHTIDAVVLPAITGLNNVCPGSTIQMNNLTPGGTWSSLNNKLSVNATGLVTGVNPSAGTQGVVKYLLRNGNNCTGFVTKNITVYPLPALPSINYKPGTIIPRAPIPGSNFCNNRTFDVVGAPSNGIFTSSNNNVMTVGFNIATGFYTVHTIGLGNATLTYSVNDANGCFNSRSLNGNVVNCPAFRESQTNSSALALENNNNFTMFPNPAKNIVNIKCETVIGNIQATITDLMGKKIKSQALSIGNNSIDITNLAKGFYLITVASETGSKTQKLIIE